MSSWSHRPEWPRKETEAVSRLDLSAHAPNVRFVLSTPIRVYTERNKTMYDNSETPHLEEISQQEFYDHIEDLSF